MVNISAAEKRRKKCTQKHQQWTVKVFDIEYQQNYLVIIKFIINRSEAWPWIVSSFMNTAGKGLK